MRRTTIGRASKSKRRSAASSRRPEPVVFFADRSIGKGRVPAALRAAGHEVELHDDHFAQDARDEAWLTAVGARGWVVLTKDRRIKSRTSELVALMRGGVAAFVLSSADMNGDQMAAAYTRALPTMLRLLAKLTKPFVARVTRAGEVEILIQAPAPRPRRSRSKRSEESS